MKTYELLCYNGKDYFYTNLTEIQKQDYDLAMNVVLELNSLLKKEKTRYETIDDEITLGIGDELGVF